MITRKYRKVLTFSSNYECALRTKEILEGNYSENEKTIARMWFIEGNNFYEISRSQKVIGKRGPMSEDMIRLHAIRLYDGLIHYDERSTKSKRSKDLSHVKRMREAKKVLMNRHPFCVCCGSGEDLELDHILTISVGGTDELSNLQLLCRKCHREKTEQEAKEFGWRNTRRGRRDGT